MRKTKIQRSDIKYSQYYDLNDVYDDDNDDLYKLNEKVDYDEINGKLNAIHQ